MTLEQHTRKQQAEAFREQKQYDRALPLYEQLWAQEPDKWIAWGYATCLRKVGRSEEALNVCREGYRLDAQFERINNIYGWCIYDVGIRQPNAEQKDFNTLTKAAQAILQLTRQEKFSPYEKAVFAVIQQLNQQKKAIGEEGQLSSRQQKDLQKLSHQTIEWLDKLDPDLLENEGRTDANGHTYASQQEMYYTSRAKAFSHLGQHQACIAACTKALTLFPTLLHDYDIWLCWYRAQAFLACGQAETAIPDLEYMLERKHDFWIRQEYARALGQVGRLDEAIVQLSQAALPSKGLGFRWKVFLELGLSLETAGDMENARRHIQLAVRIRQTEGWEKISSDLANLMQRFDITLEMLPSVKELRNMLTPFWKERQPAPTAKPTQYKGTLERVHDNGKSGHIRGSDGQRYFFAMKSYQGEVARLVAKTNIGFNLKEVTSNKTGEKEMHAVDVIVIGQ